MKSIFLTGIFSLFIFQSCNKQEETPASVQEAGVYKNDEAISDTGYNISKIPVTDKFYGTFPYFKLPDGYRYTDPDTYMGKGVTKDFDREYFFDNGSYTALEGKTFKADIRVAEGMKDKKFSPLEIQKSFDELIKKIGGVKINNGQPLVSGEEERIKREDPEAYNLGYMHSCSNWKNVNTYIIRTKDKTVFVQFNLGKEQTSISILEEVPLSNKMSIISKKDSVTAKK